MEIGLIGLGKMGYNLALNMKDHEVDVRVFTRNLETLKKIGNEGVKTYETIQGLVESLAKPRAIWLMITAGTAVDGVIDHLLEYLSPGDTIIDGGNSRFTDTLRRGDYLQERGIFFVDAGTSGGTSGARNGACMMVGGDEEPVKRLEPMLKSLNVEGGYLHVGKRGSGHYVKMVHNGIEYGMMQAIGEGFDILQKSGFEMDFEKVANVWNHGSIIEGYLIDMTKKAFEHHGNLEEIVPIIDALGEGQWTVEEAVRLGVPAPVITSSLFVRYASKDSEAFSDKVVAALRNEFGGHTLHKK
ncbi:MAG: 6-phosphogluconate dehydrogenase (decarboxylating) [Firmicutes bacterium HGW-Firmicutes-1]|jgi:6-phosphogluconate dehydrogenase|nr:MAG: 6-phosphogluconate dehydrogenase (decarboxylating) [Firmicutes bacterium HGW-Firmicutes-1]